MGNQSMKEKVKGYDAIRPRTRASVPLRKPEFAPWRKTNYSWSNNGVVSVKFWKVEISCIPLMTNLKNGIFKALLLTRSHFWSRSRTIKKIFCCLILLKMLTGEFIYGICLPATEGLCLTRNPPGYRAILIFSGKKPCTKITSTIWHSFFYIFQELSRCN